MASGSVKTYPALLPLSWVYSLVTRGRNQLFDWGILHEEQFDVPVITVGNLSVGGTGKTPHVEHLIRLLKDPFSVAVLSRGYRRRTKGFLIADAHSTAADIGDEPLQMHQKFPDVTVAVDADRCHGIHQLMEKGKAPEVIVLDDAYQHRYVKAGLSILLTDYHRLFSRDFVLPAGRLREPRIGKRRADIVVVTKCPPTLSKAESEEIARELDLDQHQQLYFSCIEYKECRRDFNFKECRSVGVDRSVGANRSGDICGGEKGTDTIPLEALEGCNVVLLAGIAHPEPMEEMLRQHGAQVKTLRFADHHNYTTEDMEKVKRTFEATAEPRLLVTTEKDAARLAGTGLLPASLQASTCTLPIRIHILHEKEETFNRQIIDYVRKNNRNGILA